MHSNTSLSQLSSTNGTDIEVYFRITSLHSNHNLKEIYYKGFDLSKAFNKDETGIFTTGTEFYKRIADTPWVGKQGDIYRAYDMRVWVFGDSEAIPNDNFNHIANEVIFHKGDDPYDSYVLGADMGHGQGLVYTAQVWVKPPPT
jgi:hypothetical protein